MSLLSNLKKNVSSVLRQPQYRWLKHHIYSILYGRNLAKLAVAFGTDKEGSHFYAKHYQRHFEHLRNANIKLLEIGIGGYESPDQGGESLRMWKAYFPKAQIFGIDIYDKKSHDESRIKTFQGSQTDERFLSDLVGKIGGVDIIVDDGSHYSHHVKEAFRILFPLLNDSGIYVVEDLQTSYWDNLAGQNWGGSPNLSADFTSMNFLKNLVDGLNYEEFTDNDYTPSYYDMNIVAIHFYHNMAFIQKGANNEGSNILGRRFSKSSTSQ